MDRHLFPSTIGKTLFRETSLNLFANLDVFLVQPFVGCTLKSLLAFPFLFSFHDLGNPDVVQFFFNPLRKMTLRDKTARLSKSLKSTPQCDELCRTKYIDAYDAFSKKMASHLKIVYTPLKKSHLKHDYHICKKQFCNKTCKGFGRNKEASMMFQKQINNGFHKNYTLKNVKSLIKKGALSGCQYDKVMLKA
jgi:hypothetical protein